jgi:hypothetical protein
MEVDSAPGGALGPWTSYHFVENHETITITVFKSGVVRGEAYTNREERVLWPIELERYADLRYVGEW